MSGVREDLGMPLFIGISVISFLTLSMIYFFDISMTNDLLLNINSFFRLSVLPTWQPVVSLAVPFE